MSRGLSNSATNRAGWVAACLIVFIIADQSSSAPNRLAYQPSRDPSGASLPTRAEYLARFPESPLFLYNIERSAPRPHLRRDHSGTIAVVVNRSLLAAHRAGFDQYVQDLAEEGWSTVLFDVEGGTPASLKQAIIDAAGDSLAGVVMWGNLPLAWFQLQEYFDNEEEPDNGRFVEFPCDLFFMDTDGEWADTSGDGVYDVHSGNIQPDIWLGRIAAYNLMRVDEDQTVADYLDRIHRYRNGEFNLPHRALSFIDDDWTSVATRWRDDLRGVIGDVDFEDDVERTNATNYSHLLADSLYEMIHVAVHSTTDSHAFLVQAHHQFDYFRFLRLRDQVTPHAFFYNLFACSALNLNTNLCLGALYALKGPYGLGAIGTTKTGGMLYYEDFNPLLSEGVPMGLALQDWLAIHADEEGHTNWSRSWFYGMTYFGDPTLGLRVGPQALRLTEAGGVAAGDSSQLTFVVINKSGRELTGVTARVTCNDPYVRTEQGDPGEPLDFAPASEAEVSSGDAFVIDRFTPNGHQIPISIQFTTSEGESWTSFFKAPVYSPVIEAITYSLDRYPEAGGGNHLQITFANTGSAPYIWSSSPRIESVGVRNFITEPYLFQRIQNPRELCWFDSIAYGVAGWHIGRPFFVKYTIEDTTANWNRCLVLPPNDDWRFRTNLNDCPEWVTHRPITEGFADSWCWRSDGPQFRGFTTNPDEGIGYLSLMDAALELPMLCYDSGAELVVQHSMDVEVGYDGGFVEVNRGDGWRKVDPPDGYDGSAVGNGSFPGGACWSGEFGFREDRLPLGETAGGVRIRFRFGSDEAVNGTGWKIDSIAVEGRPLGALNQPVQVSTTPALAAFPNPFNATALIQFRGQLKGSLDLYDLQGRSVLRLIDPSSKRNTGNSVWMDGSKLPAGIYILAGELDHQPQHLKVTLVK